MLTASLILRYFGLCDALSAEDDVAVELGDDDVAEDEDGEVIVLACLEESSRDIVLVGEGVLHRFKSISPWLNSWVTVGPVYLITYLKELEFRLTK